MTLDEFWKACENSKLTINDLLPGLIDKLCEMGDEDALAARARIQEAVPQPSRPR